MNPQADVDKAGGIGTDNSCYLATAANMLAGAGYGDGNTLQARADDIYGDLTAQFGIANTGWTDVALSWWLGSANNTWSNNPYTVVTVYGNKSPKNPWSNVDGSQFIGNELRRCCFTGLSISWPIAGATIGTGGHAITAWGDNFPDAILTVNPTQLAVTDSDKDTDGDLQKYTYDSYTSPNPDGPNEGNGWYFNYNENHPYIKHIITLCTTDDPTDYYLTQKVTGSYKITQTSEQASSDLHYMVSTDVEILSYKTTTTWNTETAPVITESGTPRNKITVDWDFSDNPVPQGTEVIITTEFILPAWNSMKYENVHFTYPNPDEKSKVGERFANIEWKVETPELPDLTKLPNNITGGFLVGSFNIIGTYENTRPEEYRFIHEYNYTQNPEAHIIELFSNEDLKITNIKFGHSWNYFSPAQLWKFDNWMTKKDEIQLSGNEASKIEIDWQGQLPYPEGENVKEALPRIKK